MRPELLLIAALLSAFLRLCGSDETPPAPPTAAATGTAEVALPAIGNGPPVVAHHGGSVVIAGQHAVEVVPHADGKVEGYVTDGQGNVPPPAGLALTVQLKGDDGADHPVVMAWSPADLRFEGHLTGTAPAAGPATVELVAGGAPVVVVVPSVVVVAPAPQVHVVMPSGPVEVHGGAPGAVVVTAPPPGVVVQGGVVVEPPMLGVEVEPPSAGVYVGGPRGSVVVNGPRAVVVAPPPPRVQVGFGVNLVGGVGVVEEGDDDGEHRGHHEHEDHGHHGGHGHGD